jgi:hypothetical protein
MWRCITDILLPSYVPEESFKLMSGSLEELTLYEFHKKVYLHYFCPVCGTEIINRTKKTGQPLVGVNVRTVDGIDVEKLKMNPFDGKTLL